MRYKKSPPLFCTSAMSDAEMANRSLQVHTHERPHELDHMEDTFPRTTPTTLDPKLEKLYRYPVLGRTNTKLMAYVDVFMDIFFGLAHGPWHQFHHLHRKLFYVMYKVFRPLDTLESSH